MLGPATKDALHGALELFLGRREGLRRFDLSIDGFWGSFRAIYFVLPLFAVSVAAEHRLMLANPEASQISDAAFLTARFLDLGLDWIAMPLLLALLARPLGIAKGFVPFVIVRNWALIVIAAPQAVIALLHAVGLIPVEAAAFLSLGIIGVMIHYSYRIVRWTLGVSVSLAAGLVVADVLISLILQIAINRMFGI